MTSTTAQGDPRAILFWQLVRFALVGGFITAIGAGLYAALVEFSAINEQLAVVIAYLLCVAIGYPLHSRWSFRGHSADHKQATMKFIVVSLVSYGLNAFFAWALVRHFGLPRWSPTVPMVFVTPLATFALNRFWVFA